MEQDIQKAFANRNLIAFEKGTKTKIYDFYTREDGKHFLREVMEPSQAKKYADKLQLEYEEIEKY